MRREMRAATVRRGLAAAATASLIAVATARAQVTPGDTVRVVHRGGGETRGAFVRVDTAALYLQPFNEPDTLRLPPDRYLRSDVLMGRRRGGAAHVGQGVARGATAGLLLGVAGMVASNGQPSHNENIGGPGLTAVLLTILGAGIGAIHGAAMAVVYEENWQPFAVDHAVAASTRAESAPVRVSPAPEPTPAPALVVGGLPSRWFRVAASDTIRLTHHAARVEGVLMRADAGVLGVQQPGHADTSIVSLDEIAAPQVRRGRAPLGARALGYGALAGAAIGIVFGPLVTRHESIVSRSFIGAGAGMLLGIPAARIQRPNWVAFDPETMRTK
jgi:hypothetical protein